MRRACFHPRSCLRCDSRGEACGRHGTGDQGHDRCTGTSVLLHPDVDYDGRVGGYLTYAVYADTKKAARRIASELPGDIERTEWDQDSGRLFVWSIDTEL